MKLTWAKLVEAVGRAGYVARGVVYLAIGVFALLAALDLTPAPKGALAALYAWGDWPLGVGLLWLMGIGLYSFAGWRMLQSVFDADNQGRSPRALAARAGQATSAVVYAGLAIAVFGLLDAIEDLREVDDQAQTRQQIESLLLMPGGEALVITTGVFVFACGIGNLVQVVGRDFAKWLECAPLLGRRAALLGRLGYASRGIVFLPIGFSIMLAGWHSRGSEAKGAGAALAAFETIPLGGALLFVTALGLIAFGLFALVEARYRTICIPEVIGGPANSAATSTLPS